MPKTTTAGPAKARRSSAKPRAERVRRRPVEVREALTSSARHVFEKRGYSGATTREIADHAGVNEVLLFRHFTNKATLFAATVYEPFAALLIDLLAEESQADAAKSVLSDRKRYIGRIIEKFRENRDLVMAVINAQAYDPHLGEAPALDGYFHDALKMVAESKVAKASGTDLDTLDKLIRCAFAAVVGVVVLEEWILPGAFENDEERREILTHFIDFGMYGKAPEA